LEANTVGVVTRILGFLVLTAVLLLPAVSSYLISAKASASLKRKKSNWTIPTAILVFIASYIPTLLLIVWALAFAGLFHR
jgi:hypothetical protein